MNEASMDSKGKKATLKLHSMLRDLEEVNDIHVASEKHLLNNHLASNNMAAENTDLQNNNNIEENRHRQLDNEEQDLNEMSLLDDEVDSTDDDIAIEEDDSWLLRTPIREDVQEKKSKLWLADDVRTPELNRVKGSLASKVELILIQSRKDKLSHLLAKHNLGSHTESAPGRLYQAESMCSVMSMDWEYDDEIEIGYHPRSMVPCSDPPNRNRRSSDRCLDDNHFDDLQPLNLDFDSSPAVRSNVPVGQELMYTRRSGMLGNAIKPRKMKASSLKSVGSGSSSQARRPSFSDRSDSSGDFPGSPRSSLGSSRNSLDSGDGISVRKNKSSGDQNVTSNHGLHKLSPSSQTDPSLTVKLPLSSSDGPVIRRRAANAKSSPMSVSSDAVPRSRLSNQGPVLRGKDQMVSPTQSKIQMPRTRASQSFTRKGVLPSQRRLPQTSELSQSPDILPRKDSSPSRRSQSPDLIPRKSGIVRRGQSANRSYQL